ncbi:O-antigen/teichoic acid export membrane protein [Bacillus tianshenii]|uniref:O-antigen/teichoic acid export membrane protein n=1 Tax=Sutcliffiella tianshenii TaxID=1463404 RepID=A0ABS2P098_9BACI|nr:oligosaccharide flippase family protein [Bacillus tianshenii]MBM7619850.1 O-antigen/teichoic acid export membrane protein [Bacillus tianshenii]
MNKFFKAVLLLAIAAFLGESLEFVVNMVLAKELGEVGLGLYMSLLPVVFLVVVIASLELPISISKFVAAKEEKYHKSMLMHAMRLTIVFMFCVIGLSVVVLPFIPVFDHYHPIVRWLIILMIPIISFSSIARGYFMGLHHMGKIAISNFLRKAVQLVLLVLVYHFFHFSMELAILIAICTLVFTELIVCFYLMYMYILQFRELKRKPGAALSAQSVRKSLLEVSIPTTGMRIFHAITSAIQPFLIKMALLKAGLSETIALEEFGLLAGVALTIGFFPGFIAHSFLIVLIPTVSASYENRDYPKLQKLLQQVMGLTFLYGIPVVLVFYHFAVPLTNIFYEYSKASSYLQLLWPYFLFHLFVIPLQAYLIGLGLIKDAFLHSMWSTLVAFALIFILGSMESLRMTGVILGMNTGIVLLTMMHYLTVCHKIKVTLWLKHAGPQKIG